MTRTKSLSEIEGAFVEASRMLDQRKLRPAVALLEFAAKSGLPAAQVMLGYCYDNGSGANRSRKKALFWYRKAASAGDSAAAANIGAIFLEEGKKAAAMRWLLKAVQLGLPEAAGRLGGGDNFGSVFDLRLLAQGSTTYTWDVHGNRATDSTGATYTHDGLGRLTGWTKGPTSLTYEVDALDRRVLRRRNGVVTARYVYEGQYRVVAKLESQSRFLYATHGHSPDVMVRAGVTYVFVKNHLGSVRAVINAATGQVVQALDYDAWGNVVSDSSPGFQPFGFAGGLYDVDSKLTHFGWRDYDASTGTWTSKDPIRQAGGLNVYLYVGASPLRFIDPSGLDPVVSFLSGAAIGAAVAIAIVVAAPLVVSAGAAALVFAGVSAGTAATLSSAIVTGALLAAAVSGAVSSGWSIRENIRCGNWDGVAFDVGLVAGGFIVGGLGGGGRRLSSLGGVESSVPRGSGLLGDRHLAYDPNYPGGSFLSWLGSAPTPQSGGGVLTLVPGTVSILDSAP